MRKKAKALLMVVLTTALFAAYCSASMAEETGTKEAKKHEEVKKKKQKAKKHSGEKAKKDAGEGGSKPSEGNGVEASVNRAGKKAMDAAHEGAEAVKNGLNEGYDKLKGSK